MNCKQCKEEMLVGYIEMLLSDEYKQKVNAHLKDCPSCAAELKELKALCSRITIDSKTLGQTNLESMVLNRVLREQSVKLRKVSKQNYKPEFWRKIMQTKITKFAIAAVIIIAVLLGLNFLGLPIDGSGLVWADVIHHIVVAETASFDLTLETEGESEQTSHIVCMAPGRIRQTLSDGTVLIVNFEQYKILILNPNEKKATLREFVAESGELSKLDVFGNIQKMLEHMIHFTDESIEVLGIRTIDEQEVSGFRMPITERDKVIGWQGKGIFTVWADTTTKLPIRWEWYDEMYGINTVVSNIELNLEVDESLFDVVIPEDYETENIRNVFKSGSEPVNSTWTDESKIIEGFRSWTIISNGKFPSSLTFNAIKDFNPEASIGLKQVGWGFNVDINGLSPEDFFGEHEPTKEEVVELNKNLNKALQGVQAVFFIPAESDWHYAGNDVTTEDVDTPIFWYQPKDSETYRVIYGDLSIEDVAPKDLPQQD